MHARDDAIVPDVMFRKIGENMEISWRPDQKDEGRLFQNRYGFITIPCGEYESLIRSVQSVQQYSEVIQFSQISKNRISIVHADPLLYMAAPFSEFSNSFQMQLIRYVISDESCIVIMAITKQYSLGSLRCHFVISYIITPAAHQLRMISEYNQGSNNKHSN